MIDLEAADEEAELERARKAQPTHQAAVPALAPVPVKANPVKRKKA